jgi:elongation factor P--(R)-beta-lysine ligase
MSLLGIQTRSKVVNLLRAALTKRGYQEIIPQLMSTAVPNEPTIEPFKVGQNYLATSPESYLKQAMAAGIGNCFAVSNVFRDQEGKNELHNPEFLMGEWYQKNADYSEIIKSVEEIIGEILHLDDFKKFSWLELWPRLPELISNEAMQQWSHTQGYSVDGATWEQLFYQYADNEILPKLPTEPFFLTDFPTKISRLAKPQAKNPDFAERFELLIDKVELADGNTEYFDAKALKWVGDERFLRAIAQLEGQRWAGVGLGVDRLAMLYGRLRSINELIEPEENN